jgi:hypothetical protein
MGPFDWNHIDGNGLTLVGFDLRKVVAPVAAHFTVMSWSAFGSTSILMSLYSTTDLPE